METVLSNEFLKCVIDEKGRISYLENKKDKSGNIISRPCDLFKAVLHRDENWEDIVFQDRQCVIVSGTGAAAQIIVSRPVTRMGEIDIDFKMAVVLEKDRLRFHAVIENRSDATVNDFYFPCIGAVKDFGGSRVDLIFPDKGGVKYINVCETLSDMDNYDNWNTISETYPWWLSMNWMMLTGGDYCLYFGSHDKEMCACTLRAVGSEFKDVILQSDKMAFAAPGETWTCPESVVSLYKGSWRKGANIYGDWAKTWRKPRPQPEWVRSMTGYFLVINRQQFGDELWPYAEIPQLWELAKAYGFDTLGLFGWYSTGHDNRYPQIEPGENQGGEALLRENIAAVKKDGGRVTMYQNGHLIDPSSDFYKKYGDACCVMTRWGLPYHDQYSKYHNSDFLQHFSKKTFMVVCPSFEPFYAALADTIKMIHGLGADGILIDQIGGIVPYPCFNEKHDHGTDKPSLAYSKGRLKMLGSVCAEIDKYEKDGFALFTETLTDSYSGYFDALHSFGSHPGKEGERIGLNEKNTKAKMIMFPEPFRYLFPETIVTVRNPHAYVDYRAAGFAFVYGFRFELELRYLTDREFILEDRRPDWRENSKAVSNLRKKYADFLLTGTYHADEGLQHNSDAVIASVFTNDAKKIIALWNDSPDEKPVNVSLENAEITGWETPYEQGKGAPVSIGAQGVMILFTK